MRAALAFVLVAQLLVTLPGGLIRADVFDRVADAFGDAKEGVGRGLERARGAIEEGVANAAEDVERAYQDFSRGRGRAISVRGGAACLQAARLGRLVLRGRACPAARRPRQRAARARLSVLLLHAAWHACQTCLPAPRPMRRTQGALRSSGPLRSASAGTMK